MAFSLSELIAGPRNLAEQLGADEHATMGRTVVEEYEIDCDSRSDWLKRSDDAINLAMQTVKKKTYPWPDAANIKFPLLTIAALQFHARVYPNVVSDSPVKYRVYGDHPEATARGGRISTHMNYQLLEEDEDWEEQFDTLLLALPITGCEFDKKYFDPALGYPVTEWVSCRHFVLPYFATSLSKASRGTQELTDMTPRRIDERMRDGRWLDIELGPIPHNEGKRLSEDERRGEHEPHQDPDASRLVLEQHRFLDLDDDGYTEPYIVTVDHSSTKVLRVVPRFGPNSVRTDADDALRETLAPEQQRIAELVQRGMMETARAQQQAMQEHILETRENARILSIKPYEHYTKYDFLPSIDGGIYGMGFGNLSGPLNKAVNTIINQLIDAGTLQNLGGGFKARGAKLGKSGTLFFKPGLWVEVECTGDDLRKNLVPLATPQPSAVLFNLLGLIIEVVQQLNSVSEMMVGKTPGQNTPAATSMAALEQGMAVFSGIYKRVLRGCKRSFQKHFRINRDNVDPARYAELLGGEAGLLMLDYQKPAKHLRPAADPSMITDQQKMTKSMTLAARAQSVPGYDPVEVELRVLDSMGIEDRDKVFPTQQNEQSGKIEPAIPPPQDPEIAIKIEEERRRTLEAQDRAEHNQGDLRIRAAVGMSQVALNEAKALETAAKADMEPFKEARELLKTITEQERDERDRREAKEATAGTE